MTAIEETEAEMEAGDRPGDDNSWLEAHEDRIVSLPYDEKIRYEWPDGSAVVASSKSWAFGIHKSRQEAAERLFARLEHLDANLHLDDPLFAMPASGPREIEGWHRPRTGPVYTAWSCDEDGEISWWQGEFSSDAEAGDHAAGFPNGGIVQGPDGKWDYGFGWAESPEAAVALGEEYYPRDGD